MKTRRSTRWAFLRPWLEPLRQRLDFVSHSDDFVGVGHWDELLNVSLLEDRKVPIRVLRDALVLLAMVARVDADAFKQVLVDYCELKPEAKDMPMFEDVISRPARFQLILMGSESDWILEEVVELFSGLDEPPSTRFTAVARKIAAMSTKQGVPLEPLDVPIFIYVEFTRGFKGELIEHLQRELLAIQGKQIDWKFPIAVPGYPTDQSVIPCALTLEALKLDCTEVSLVVEDVKCIERVMSGERRLPVTELVLAPLTDDEDVDEAEDAQIFGTIYQRVLCPHESMSCELDIFSPCVGGDASTLLGRFASILPESRSVQSVDIQLNIGNESDPKIWEYIAYGFFTAQASPYSTTTSLTLSWGRLDSRGAEAFAAVLNSSDPARHVYGSRDAMIVDYDNALTHSMAIRQSRMRLGKGTSVVIERMDPTEVMTNDTATWELQTDVEGVRFLDEITDDVCKVLIPGFGVCAVQLDQLFPIDEDLEASDYPRSQGITRLEMDELRVLDDGEPLYNILERIGDKLTCLGLFLIMDRPLNVRRVLRCCQNLEILGLGNLIIDSSELLGAFHDDNVRITELRCQCANRQIIDELSNPGSAFARSIKRFSYSARGNFEEEKAILDSLVAMLDANRILEYLQLEVPDELYQQYKLDIDRHHLTPIPVVSKSFPLQCRLAFLSVFRLRPTLKRAKYPRSALANLSLDRDVVNHIFDFAAECVLRRVYYVLDPEAD